MPTIHTSGFALGEAIGKVLNALTECPLRLCLRYRAEVLTLSEDGLLKLVSRFHRLHIKKRDLLGLLTLGACLGFHSLRLLQPA